MTWQIFSSSAKGRVAVALSGTEGETESGTILAYLKEHGLNAKWWATQKTFSCRKVKK